MAATAKKSLSKDIGKKETKLFMLLLKAKVTLLILLYSMTSLMEHTVVQPTKCRFLIYKMNQ